MTWRLPFEKFAAIVSTGLSQRPSITILVVCLTEHYYSSGLSR